MSTVKTNDILRELFKKGGIQITDELEKILATEDLAEIPTSYWDQVSPQLIGVGQAANNKDVFGAVQKKVFAKIENEFDTVLSGMGIEYEQLLGAQPDTFQKRLEALQKLETVYAEKYKTKDDGSGAKSKEAIEQLQKEKKAIADEIVTLKAGFAEKETDWKIKHLIQSEMGKHKFRDDLGPLADDLRKAAAQKIRSHAVYKFEGDKLGLFHTDNPEVPLTGADHGPMSLSSLVESIIQPYVAKADSAQASDSKKVVTSGNGEANKGGFGAPIMRG